MSEQESIQCKPAHPSLRLQIITAIMILLLYGTLPFLMGLIHPFLLVFHWLICVVLFFTIIVSLCICARRLLACKQQMDSQAFKKQIAVFACLCVFFEVGFFTPPHWWVTQSAGLWVHYKFTADVDELRAFAENVKYPAGQNSIDYNPKSMPDPIRKYRPMHAFVSGHDGSRTVSLSWGGGMIGGWGLRVTDPNAPREQEYPEMYKDPSLAPRTVYFYIAPGAYVFFHEG